MPKTHIEIAYFTARLDTTVKQANISKDECPRASHEGLAALYRSKLVQLRDERTILSLRAAADARTDMAIGGATALVNRRGWYDPQ